MKLQTKRSSITWEQLQEMAKDPLVTIAAHTISHPPDLRQLSDQELKAEVWQSKQLLESQLGIKIRYFTYPAGKSDARVKQVVREAGYEAALSMDDQDQQFAGESPDLLTIGRFGQLSLREVIPQAWEGPPLPKPPGEFSFYTRITKQEYLIDGISLILAIGGQPTTIHADSRYQVWEIIANSEAVAGVDGAFFSMKYLDSDVIIGPVLTQRGFFPGNPSENRKLEGRPLVLIGPNQVKFISFDSHQHNSLEGLQAEMKTVTDAFVGAAWLVRDGQGMEADSFGDLFDFQAPRHRAFWGIHQGGQPMIGVSTIRVDSVSLGKALAKLGFKEVIMLDSGASTSLAFEGKSLVGYVPRPVPHVVALIPPPPTPILDLAWDLPAWPF